MKQQTETEKKVVLLGMSLEELTTVALRMGMPRFAGKQLAEWIYVRRATDFAEMTNISQANRQKLAEISDATRGRMYNVRWTEPRSISSP